LSEALAFEMFLRYSHSHALPRERRIRPVQRGTIGRQVSSESTYLAAIIRSRLRRAEYSSGTFDIS